MSDKCRTQQTKNTSAHQKRHSKLGNRSAKGIGQTQQEVRKCNSRTKKQQQIRNVKILYEVTSAIRVRSNSVSFRLFHGHVSEFVFVGLFLLFVLVFFASKTKQQIQKHNSKSETVTKKKTLQQYIKYNSIPIVQNQNQTHNCESENTI